jgi:RNase H
MMNPIVWTPTDEDRTNLEAIREALQTGRDAQPDAAILSYVLRAAVAALGPSGGQSTVPVSSPEPAHISTEETAASAYDPDQVIIAHTDGACSGNPGPGGWAVVFSQGGKEVAEHSGGSLATTNNRMELTAVREALKRALRA